MLHILKSSLFYCLIDVLLENLLAKHQINVIVAVFSDLNTVIKAFLILPSSF